MNIHEIKNDPNTLLIEFLTERWPGYSFQARPDGDVDFRDSPHQGWVQLGSDHAYYLQQAQKWDAAGRTRPAMDYW